MVLTIVTLLNDQIKCTTTFVDLFYFENTSSKIQKFGDVKYSLTSLNEYLQYYFS